MLTGRYSSRLAVSAGIAGACLLISAPLGSASSAEPEPVPTASPSPDPEQSPSPSPEPSAPPTGSEQPSSTGGPVEPAAGEPPAEPPRAEQSAAGAREVDSPAPVPGGQPGLVVAPVAEPSALPEPAADGVPIRVSSQRRGVGLPDPTLLIVAGSGGLVVSTVGVTVMWYRRRTF